MKNGKSMNLKNIFKKRYTDPKDVRIILLEKIGSGADIKIVPPIRILPSKVYALKIEDSTGRQHYFDQDGVYDGWSMPVDINLN